MAHGTTLVAAFSLAYADNLNLTGITDQVTAAHSNVLGYTPANRLASASGVWGNKAYSYDGVGNRISDVTTGGASVSRIQYYSNTSNRLNDIWENGAQLRVYTYDGAGNTLTESRPGEAFAYTYNKRNRLSSVTRNGSLWGTYVYNAFEQLVSRTSPAPAAPLGTIHYIHDLDGHLIAEADGATGATLRDYVWLPANDNEVQDLPLAVIDGVNTATHVTSFIHTDHLGRPTRMTNAAKSTVWQAVWTPWGEAQSMTGSVTQNLRFPGQYFHIETNLNYNHHRTYDPVTGRYTQPDPLGFVDGPSVYTYARSSPFMVTDRDGRCPVCIPVAIGIGIGLLEEFLTNRCARTKDYLFAGLGGGVGSLVGGNAWRAFKRVGLLPRLTRSHGFPSRWFKPGKRQLNILKKNFNPRLPKWLDGEWNISKVSPRRHFKHDPHYYGDKKQEYLSWGNRMSPAVRFLDRIPDWAKGSAIGGAIGSFGYNEDTN